ncbi:COMM domain-containing protein 4 isoform X5 [Symphalangus syndactylus]|uniref:COMM domain-containing protein 4 isoform X5 n=1 Tax=Symphalangus syndactylus TaxID=9590 RepID=UPI0030069035
MPSTLKVDSRSWLAEVQFVYLGLGGKRGRRVSSDREQHVQRLQRFRFCGDLDCPDWVLAEISTLAKMSSVKLRLLCSQVLKELLGQGIDYEKILKLTADAKFESGDVKATVAVLSFILSSAAKHSVDGESLSSELQQLGLPKELLRSTCRARGQPVPLLRGEAKPLAEALAGLQPTHE